MRPVLRADDRTTFKYLDVSDSRYPQVLSRLNFSVCLVPGPLELSVALVLRLCAVADRSYLFTFFYQLRLHFELKCNLNYLYQLTGYKIATYTHANCVFFCHYWVSIFSAPNLYLFLFSPILATCSSHLIVSDLVTQITFREQYDSWRSALCSFLQFSVNSSLLGPNNLLAAQSVKGGSKWAVTLDTTQYTRTIAII